MQRYFIMVEMENAILFNSYRKCLNLLLILFLLDNFAFFGLKNTN